MAGCNLRPLNPNLHALENLRRPPIFRTCEEYYLEQLLKRARLYRTVVFLSKRIENYYR